MEAHSKVMGLSAKVYRAEIKRLYNGYRFWLDEGENVCNNSIPVKGMLFQTGYLTIKDFNGTSFDLCVPDEEVRQDLSALMAGLVADKDVRAQR